MLVGADDLRVNHVAREIEPGGAADVDDLVAVGAPGPELAALLVEALDEHALRGADEAREVLAEQVLAEGEEAGEALALHGLGHVVGELARGRERPLGVLEAEEAL